MKEVQRFVANIKTLPSLPSVALKVEELLNSPKSDAEDFDAVISQDPALTAKLLMIVNSAFYGLRHKVDNVTRAVAIVGFKQVRDLVTSISVMDVFKGIESKSLNMKEFWKHCVACGVASQVLAIYSGDPNPEVYFTAGLLHDVGKLLMLTERPSAYQEVLHLNKNDSVLGYTAENQVFGFTHAEVGVQLSRQWKHPLSLQAALGHHHPVGGTGNFPGMAATVHVADIVIHACNLGNSGNCFVPPLSPVAWDMTRLKASMLAPAVRKIEQHLDEITSALLS
jgi:putative nucleotidyltransferase with HDIG domain